MSFSAAADRRAFLVEADEEDPSGRPQLLWAGLGHLGAVEDDAGVDRGDLLAHRQHERARGLFFEWDGAERDRHGV